LSPIVPEYTSFALILRPSTTTREQIAAIHRRTDTTPLHLSTSAVSLRPMRVISRTSGVLDMLAREPLHSHHQPTVKPTSRFVSINSSASDDLPRMSTVSLTLKTSHVRCKRRLQCHCLGLNHLQCESSVNSFIGCLLDSLQVCRFFLHRTTTD
jgi:hypothetical protein